MPYTLQGLSAVFVIILLLPMLVIIAAVILVADVRPIIYRQTRIGLNRLAFTIVKFRTMVPGANDYLTLAESPLAPLTRSVPLLRRTGLDELPPLRNIIRGQMAIIGPRATVPEVAINIPPEYGRRYTVLPGVTSLAQVNGRHELPWSQRLKYDAEYALERSAMLDFRILFRTISTTIHTTVISIDPTSLRTDDLRLLHLLQLKGDE